MEQLNITLNLYGVFVVFHQIFSPMNHLTTGYSRKKLPDDHRILPPKGTLATMTIRFGGFHEELFEAIEAILLSALLATGVDTMG